MTKKEARKAARVSSLMGKTKQEILETLKETSKLPAEVLAKIIQSIPTLAARQKYKAPNIFLIILLSITILFKIIAVIPIIIETGIRGILLIFILPLINILLLWGVATFNLRSHRLVAILTIIGLISSFKVIASEPFEPLMLIDFAIAAGLIILGFYLDSKLCRPYLIVRERYQNDQGQDKLRNVIKFDE